MDESRFERLDDYLAAVADGAVAASCTSGSWNGAASRFSDEQYARSCVLDRADCSADWREKPAKQRYSLPIREPGGAVNTTAVSAARGRLSQTQACSEAKSKASARLDRAASACGMNKEAMAMQTGGFVPTTTTTGGTSFVIQPREAPEEQPSRPTDARVVGQLVAVAGRPWCLKPESMDVLVAAIEGGITAGMEIDMPDNAPKAEKVGSIAMIPLTGLITPAGGGVLGALLGMGGGLQEFRGALRQAVSDDDVKHIVLRVDSPGGLVDHVPETARAVRAVREYKPVTAVASTQAASAAYWIASQANNIVVTPSGEIGSIGVYQLHTDKSEALAQHGLSVTLTSAGKYKTEGNQYEPLSEAGKEARQRKVDRYYEKFVHDVAAGRGVSDRAVREGYGEGRTLLAEDAVEDGLADMVGTVDDTLTAVAEQLIEAAESGTTALEAARRRVAVEVG